MPPLHHCISTDDAELTQIQQGWTFGEHRYPHACVHDADLAQIGAELARQHPVLPPPITVPWPEAPMLALDRGGVPWVYGPAERDPLRDRRGRVAVPRRQRAHLRGLAARGVPFHRIAIAHEVRQVSAVRNIMPELKDGPLACDDATARLLVGPQPVHPGVARGTRVLSTLLGGSAADDLLDTLVDPVVWGVVGHRPPVVGDLTLWFELARWAW